MVMFRCFDVVVASQRLRADVVDTHTHTHSQTRHLPVIWRVFPQVQGSRLSQRLTEPQPDPWSTQAGSERTQAAHTDTSVLRRAVGIQRSALQRVLQTYAAQCEPV